MTPIRPLACAGLVLMALLAGCATRQPLPILRYQEARPAATQPHLPVSAALVAGSAVGHSLTTYALMPGGWSMPMKTGPSPTGAFNVEDQAAVLENLMRVLNERGLARPASATDTAAAALTLRFLKTEHFPDMQDYTLDVLVTARRNEAHWEKIYHVSTIGSVNIAARMFQNGLDGRRRAAELLLAAVVPDLESWLLTGAVAADTADAFVIAEPFVEAGPRLVIFLAERYARPSTFWKDGIHLHVARPSEQTATIELRWAGSASPPFCRIDVYGDAASTRFVVREVDRLLTGRVGITEAVAEFVETVPSAATEVTEPSAS